MTTYRVPLLSPPANCNVFEGEQFIFRLVFGMTSITSGSTLARECTVTRNSPGRYTIQFPNTYKRKVEFHGGMEIASGTTLFPVSVTDTLSTDGKLIFELRTAAGTATDPTSGDKLLLTVTVTNNRANEAYLV